jgi:hypothetical protein
VLLTPIAHTSSSAPRLKFFQTGSDQPQCVTIDHAPFRIGRCETCDLQIDSAEVSREHAQISKRGNIWVIRDLGSTNGTQVNGKPVRESFLADGDILAIAETEVTFVASSVTPFQRMATQPIQQHELSQPAALLPPQIKNMRARTEATLWQAIPVQLATVVSLCGGEDEAFFAQCGQSAKHDDAEFGAFHEVERRYRELFRRRAMEMAQAPHTTNRIFLPADIAELASTEKWLDDLEHLRDRIPCDFELGVAIALSRIADPSALDEACRELRNAKLLLALVDFQGSGGQVSELASCAPDYLLLSDGMLKGISVTSQSLRRLELVRTTCQQLGIQAVLPPCGCQKSIAQCRQIGYEFAIQSTSSEKHAIHRSAAPLSS